MADSNSKHQDSLQSICYKRGSLQLLDQRKLPLETVYLEIKGADDGWHAIRDMVVRGAPAIAIAAALSLAVEVSNLEDFIGTSDDAASFLNSKLDYLVTSRPTAVNLSDAVTKLKGVISNAAATAFEAMSVFQAFLEAAEDMLREDVAANRAIGLYGASFLQSHIKDSKNLSILTHCNTGSLATAGYGTALGVIRSVHAEGILLRAYCTETRPFNQWEVWMDRVMKCLCCISRRYALKYLLDALFIQTWESCLGYIEVGSRLTAFELVHDNIPATLIADSAAAALMQAGRVDAVIVGADRVAANGKIPKELLNSRGGLGEQVAASGICVWNPAFDVTPADLIAGIITEKVMFSTSRISYTMQPVTAVNKRGIFCWTKFYPSSKQRLFTSNLVLKLVDLPTNSIDLRILFIDKGHSSEGMGTPKYMLNIHNLQQGNYIENAETENQAIPHHSAVLEMHKTNLDEANFLGVAAEALPTAHEPILSDQPMWVSANPTDSRKINA
ncbi:Methylthioribose-1-phosphate isomerase [Vitis vinifera]|uniref:Methylthioribose-1-phosphate isomerase n=1 Tax=Vitis vinifera TaxID=29760 RepID=A0A438E8H2_VITVI|nr:Methylthioribose-1-phosphate isomerase [Vitis vinifera]